jgi:hypothetical protein
MLKVILLLFPLFSFATDGMITVLEAPLFEKPSEDSKIVQWMRKGEKIYLNAEVEQIFEGDQSGDFYRALSSGGEEVFILRHHVWVYTNDKKEREQTLYRPDKTDYRLVEPLSKRYPLADPEGFRGLVSLSFGSTPSYNYPYNQKIKSRNSGLQNELNFLAARRGFNDLSNRWYIGGALNVRRNFQEFQLETRRVDEEWYKISFGPYISYDTLRDDDQRFSVWTSLLFVPYTQVNINQRDDDGTLYERSLRSYSLASRFGTTYQRIKILEEIDFIVGIWFEVESEQTFYFVGGDKKSNGWVNGGADSFTIPYQFTLAGQIGFQTAY